MERGSIEFSLRKRFYTHVASLVFLVPPETAIDPSVALQCRRDAGRVLAIVLVVHAGCKKTKETINPLRVTPF